MTVRDFLIRSATVTIDTASPTLRLSSSPEVHVLMLRPIPHITEQASESKAPTLQAPILSPFLCVSHDLSWIPGSCGMEGES